MKLIILSLLLALFTFADATSNIIKSTYKDSNDTYLLKANYKKVTTWQGQEFVVNYSVYKNKQFLHGIRSNMTRRSNVGRLFSCYTKEPKIIPLNTMEKQIGWAIEGFGLCGNTVSNIIEIIIPKSYDYHVKTILSKSTPVIIPKSNSLDIWYYHQEWGIKGTAVSFHIPHKLKIETGSLEINPVKKGNIMDGLANQEKNSSKHLFSFLGLFVAGIRDTSPELMEYAIKKHYKHDEEHWYKHHFKNSSKKSMQELVEKMRVIKSNSDFINNASFFLQK